MKKLLYALSVAIFMAMNVQAQKFPTVASVTSHFKDADGNGNPDVGEHVTGKYTQEFLYDSYGAYFFDYGDGTFAASLGVDSPDDLDGATLTDCVYDVTYRGLFQNGPDLVDGSVTIHATCSGFDFPDGADVQTAIIVGRSDPRYIPGPGREFMPGWEYFSIINKGQGNLTRRHH